MMIMDKYRPDLLFAVRFT